MDEITIDDKTYISSKRAAAITGYAKDYVGQLCREGRVEARLIGRSWYVLEDSIRKHRFESEDRSTEESQAEAEASEITNNEAVWKESVYTPEEVEMLPVVEEKKQPEDNPIALEEEKVEEISAPLLVGEEVEQEPQPESVVEEVEKEEEIVSVEPESQAAWESWFSGSTVAKPDRSDEPVKPNIRAYKPHAEEEEAPQHIRVNKNVSFDIGAIEPVAEEPAVIVRERKVRKTNYLVIKALACATIILFASLAVIGSGVVETIGGNTTWGIIDVLGGASTIK